MRTDDQLRALVAEWRAEAERADANAAVLGRFEHVPHILAEGARVYRSCADRLEVLLLVEKT